MMAPASQYGESSTVLGVIVKHWIGEFPNTGVVDLPFNISAVCDELDAMLTGTGFDPEMIKNVKKVDVFGSIMEVLNMMSHQNEKIESILMGPDDFKLLCKQYHDTRLKNGQDMPLTLPIQIMGVPIRLKTANGIDFEYPLQDWNKFLNRKKRETEASL